MYSFFVHAVGKTYEWMNKILIHFSHSKYHSAVSFSYDPNSVESVLRWGDEVKLKCGGMLGCRWNNIVTLIWNMHMKYVWHWQLNMAARVFITIDSFRIRTSHINVMKKSIHMSLFTNNNHKNIYCFRMTLCPTLLSKNYYMSAWKMICMILFTPNGLWVGW